MQSIANLVVVIVLFSAIVSSFPSKIPLDAIELPEEMNSTWDSIPNPFLSALKLKNDCSCETEPSLLFRSERVPRSPQFYAEGGHSKYGTNLHIQGQTQLWQSGNQRHQMFGRGGYSQSLGGLNGNSKPNFNAGLSYQFRF